MAVRQSIREYRREGRSLDDIIQEETEKQNNLKVENITVNEYLETERPDLKEDWGDRE